MNISISKFYCYETFQVVNNKSISLKQLVTVGIWNFCIVGNLSNNPAGTATLSQGCHNVVVDVVTTLWHGRIWKLYRRQFPTLWQRRSPTLSRRCLNVATTLPQHWITRPFYYGLFWFLSLHRNVKITKALSDIKHASFLFKKVLYL